MQHSLDDIKEKLLRALDKDNNVVDMATVIEVIATLEKTQISVEELKETRLGKFINELRKKTSDERLAKRAKDLVRRWRAVYLPTENNALSNNNVIANGEHHSSNASSPIISHLPGPGPGGSLPPRSGGGGGGAGGLGWGVKPASPAFLNHHHHHPHHVQQQLHHHRNFSSGGNAGVGTTMRETSPGNSQCSSVSISPPGFVSRSGSSVNCHTPKVVDAGGGCGGQHHFPGFKPISPATTASSTHKYTRSVNISSSSSSPLANNHHRASPGASLFLNSHHRSSRNKYGKRGRDEAEEDSSGDSHFQQVGPSNSSLSPPARVGNGIGTASGVGVGGGGGAEDSRDSFFAESSNSSLIHRPSSTTTKLSGKRVRGPSKKAEKCDVLKEKIASHLKTPKVKTTAEIYQELKAKSGAGGGLGGSAVRRPGEVEASGSGAATAAVDEASLAHTRRMVYSSFLGNDEDVSKNKSDLMQKFLNDSAVPELLPGSPDVDAILASLPPLNLEEIVWSEEEPELEGEGEDQDEEKKEVEVPEESVERLAGSDWECMNGNYDRTGEFRRWNQMLSRDSGPENVLHLLPYVDID